MTDHSSRTVVRDGAVPAPDGSGDSLPGHDGGIEARIAEVDALVAGLPTRPADSPAAGSRPAPDTPSTDDLIRLVDTLDDAGRRAVAMWAHRRYGRQQPSHPTDTWYALVKLAKRRLDWTPAELRWLFAEAPDTHAFWDHRYLLPLSAAERVGTEHLVPLFDTLRAMVTRLNERRITIHGVDVDDRRSLDRRLRALVGAVRPTGFGVPESLLHDGDPYGPAARRAFAEPLTAPGAVELLQHCLEQDRVEPKKAWHGTAERLLADTATGLDLARGLLELFAAGQDTGHDCQCGKRHPSYPHPDTETLLRGLVWVVADRDEEWVTDLLAGVTSTAAGAFRHAPGFPYAPRVANAAVRALSRRPGPLPVSTLTRLAVTVRNRALRTRLESALDGLGALRGWAPGEVLELAVNRHGLGPDGRRVERVGPYDAVVEVAAGRGRLSFVRDDRPLKGVPAAVKEAHPDRLRELRHLVKEVNATLVTERRRVEELLAQDRDWAYPDWVERYLAHPVTGWFGRALIWQTRVDGEWRGGLPRLGPEGWTLVGPDGVGWRGDRVRLWHPLRVDPAEVTRWRDRIVESELRQPFKQAFREVYLLTPAEELTRTYSNRFAGHILHYRQANALLRARGWQAGYLGYWSGGHESEAVREFDGGRWRASFFHEMVDNQDPRDHEVRYCSTDQVRFARRDGAVWTPAPLAEVPPLVLSEAMRDVDLFVGVTSIAADPTWLDRGEDRFHAYWHGVGFGPLTASAEIRRDALRRLLPRTRIADRVEVAERFLRVRGNLRTYRIHLGSGNIMMEPNDAYLCIVRGRERGETVRLPFDEDEGLSVIVSKAFLLAADDRITDPTILRQIRPGG